MIGLAIYSLFNITIFGHF